ncbi:hypothetical protein [Neorhizobium sp. AL 9.2.2]|uniref:hypothetical protein n=1 Tax=Neorhizobium sp. AL 9.2.2 TaxID=2712894 RepID=UPI001572FB3F|nr:hypothetical protein [Neorhizobium sp. AL 9.2.2]NSY17273.1 hypothetical protein [Neorhizobium sp. AL 9.2.2]
MVTKSTRMQSRRTSTASKVFSAGELLEGELGINMADRKLYAKDAGGTVFKVAPPASALGDGIGIDWNAFQTRILATKTHAAGEAQSLLDIQVNTRSGTIDGGGGVGSAVSITSRAVAGTKYGHFNLVALLENNSSYVEGVDPFFAHSAAVSYINQNVLQAAPGFAHAFEVKETHGQANPTNGSLASEHTVIATGTDANNKRTMVFLPTNKLNGGDGIFTEFANGIFWKTSANTKYKRAMYLEGQYDAVLRASEISAENLIVATGAFSKPVIDLHALSVTGGAAIAINAAHSLQFQNADGVGLGGLGYDNNTLTLAGVLTQSGAGAVATRAVINVNGTRYAIDLRALA